MQKRLIRIALFIALAGAAVASIWQGLKSRTHALTASREILRNIASESRNDNACSDQERMRSLLAQLSQVDAHSPYWLLSPLLGDPDITRKNAQAIIDESLRQAIVPDLICRISQRANQLASSSDDTSAKEAVLFEPADLPGSRIVIYLKSLLSLEANVVRFHQLGIFSSSENAGQSMQDFYLLEEYVYGSPLPESIRQTAGRLAPEIADGKYWKGLHLPYGMQQYYAGHLKRLSTNLRLQLNQEIDMGATLLAHTDRNGAPADGNAMPDQWLSWVDRSWLHSDASRNPCAAIRSALQESIDALISQYGYPESFAQPLDTFDADRCYQPLMARLSGMRLPPYGPVFIRSKDGSLQINPEMRGEPKSQTR